MTNNHDCCCGGGGGRGDAWSAVCCGCSRLVCVFFVSCRSLRVTVEPSVSVVSERQNCIESRQCKCQQGGAERVSSAATRGHTL